MRNENPFGHKVKLVCLESSLTGEGSLPICVGDQGCCGNRMGQSLEVFWGGTNLPGLKVKTLVKQKLMAEGLKLGAMSRRRAPNAHW